MGEREWELQESAEKACDCYRPIDHNTLQVVPPATHAITHAVCFHHTRVFLLAWGYARTHTLRCSGVTRCCWCQRLGAVSGKLSAKGVECEDLSKQLRVVNEEEEAAAKERTTKE